MAKIKIGGYELFENCDNCTEHPSQKNPPDCSRNKNKWEEFKIESFNKKQAGDLNCPDYVEIHKPLPKPPISSNSYDSPKQYK